MEHSILPHLPATETLDQLAACACGLLQSEVAILSHVSRSEHRILGSHGLRLALSPDRLVPLSHSICSHTLAMGAPLIIANGYTHPLVNRHPAVIDLGIVSYLGQPVKDPAAQVIGVVCVCNRRPRDWSDKDVHRLALFARAVRKRLMTPKALPAAEPAL